MELLKTDLLKSDPAYYKATQSPQLVHLEDYYYLTIGGQGAPEDALFENAIKAIYAVAFGIKFLCKAEDNDFTVPKMECQWWVAGGLGAQHLFTQTPRDQWHWKIAIRMPDMVESDHFFRAIHQAKAKNTGLDSLNHVKFETIKEGMCVQILHIGSWEAEKPSVDKILAFALEQGLEITGFHKEIYLSDPQRVSQDKLRTILRYQVKEAGN